MNKNDWNSLSKWLKVKNYNLQLDPYPNKFTNGMGNLNFKIFLNNKAYVLRRPPLGPIPPGANDMKREHLVMNALNKKLSLVPNSIIFCEDKNIFGAPFHIMEFKNGFTINGDTIPKRWNTKKNTTKCHKITKKVVR